VKRKAEDEDENEDENEAEDENDGCRRDRAPALVVVLLQQNTE
jgi:hypothetical protein